MALFHRRFHGMRPLRHLLGAALALSGIQPIAHGATPTPESRWPRVLPRHPVWTSSLGGAVAYDAQASAGLRTEHALLLPLALQVRADLATMPVGNASGVSDWRATGHASAGLHFAFRSRTSAAFVLTGSGLSAAPGVDTTGIYKEGYRGAAYRWNLHSFGVLVGYGGHRSFLNRTEVDQGTRVVFTGAHVFSPMWMNAEVVGPARNKGVISWQIGQLLKESNDTLFEVSMATGPLKVGALLHLSDGGSLMLFELGAQIQSARDVGYWPR